MRQNSPRKMVEPTRVADEKLRRPWRDPMRKPVVVLLRGLDLPAHDEEHDKDDGNLLRLATDVGKRAQDIREEL